MLERRLGPRPESEMVDYVDPETNKGPKIGRHVEEIDSQASEAHQIEREDVQQR